MTDNLKTRIAEAIQLESKNDYGIQVNVNAITKAVLDIVEPMMPKWMPMKIKGGNFAWYYAMRCEPLPTQPEKE